MESGNRPARRLPEAWLPSRRKRCFRSYDDRRGARRGTRAAAHVRRPALGAGEQVAADQQSRGQTRKSVAVRWHAREPHASQGRVRIGITPNGILKLCRRGGPAPVREYREFCREGEHGTFVHGIAHDLLGKCGRDILSAYVCKRRDACRASHAQEVADIGVCLAPQAAQRCHMEFRPGGETLDLGRRGARLAPACAPRTFSQIAPRLPRRSRP